MTDPQPDAAPRRSTLPAAVFATIVALLLQFSAFSKVATAQKRKLVPYLEDHGIRIVEHWAIGALEMAIVVAVLLGYRWKRTWQVTAVFFGGLAGYALWALVKNVDCGCFGELVKLPRGFSFVMDLCFLAGALVIAATLGVRRHGIAAALIAAALAAALGYAYAEWSYKDPTEIVRPHRDTADPVPLPIDREGQGQPDSHPAQPEPDKGAAGANAEWWSPGGHAEGVVPGAAELVEYNPLLQPVRQGDELQTWYIFLHDPDCHVCEEVRPFVDLAAAEAEAEEFPILRFIEASIPVLEEEYAIPYWAWPSTPTVLIVRGGKIIEQHAGEDVLFEVMPTHVRERLMSGDL